MRKVDEQINISNRAICKHIANSSSSERGFLSQNILKNLRDFVEAVSVKASGSNQYSYDIFQNTAKQYVSSIANLKFLSKFHEYLQKTVSHYLPDEENSERLMLKYYEYLLKLKSFLKNKYNFDVLENINNFPVANDPKLNEYYEKIVEKINNSARGKSSRKDRYYIKKVKPFFINNEVYYEVTFTSPVDNVNKFNRVIAFTKLEILPNYAVKLSISSESVYILEKKMPIYIIDNWEVSIRPCEIQNFAKIFSIDLKNKTNNNEIYQLMFLLTKTGFNLVEVVELSDEYYIRFKNKILEKAKTTHFLDILDKTRELIKNNDFGSNIVKYLLYNLNNKIIKLQFTDEPCNFLSNLNLKWGCKPFDEMPFVTSLLGHNPRIQDLSSCIGIENREHELFARLIKNNIENKGCLYTKIKDIHNFENINELISTYNNKLYFRHKPKRNLEKFKNHIFINEYEQDTYSVIKKLKGLSSLGIKNYSNSVGSWLQKTSDNIDDDNKKKILKNIFEKSHVAFIYGSAGTGKTRLIEHISSFFHEQNKLYLANTHPAVNNLKSRITTANSTFNTISSFLHKNDNDTEFDLLIIDESSTVSNSDMLNILEKVSFKLLVLVGDVFQIESIRFGNWFGVAESFIPKSSVFELTKPFRSTDKDLLSLWDKVRNTKDDIAEHFVNNDYSTNLDESIFEYSNDDEIILCLNYDGLYGINNINKFLQGNNKNESIQWGVHTYKVGDPILFNESDRFRPLIHNNLKGKIIDIKNIDNNIQFDIEIDKSINEFDINGYDLELLDESANNKSVIRFTVNFPSNSDEDTNDSSEIVPFQIAYAVSIHKAQGLEYDSVKIVITNEVDEMITHNIFYTAITRAKKKLKIYWTPEVQQKILSNLKPKFNKKDVYLLKEKFNI